MYVEAAYAPGSQLVSAWQHTLCSSTIVHCCTVHCTVFFHMLGPYTVLIALSFAHILCSSPILQCTLQALQLLTHFLSHRFHFEICNSTIKFCWAQTRLVQRSFLFCLPCFVCHLFFLFVEFFHSGFSDPSFFLGTIPCNCLGYPLFWFSSKYVWNWQWSDCRGAVANQVKLCPYDEEEPAIWFCLIETQFAAAGIKLQKLRDTNALASLPNQVLWDILDTVDVCNESDQPFYLLKDGLPRKFGKSKRQSYFE